MSKLVLPLPSVELDLCDNQSKLPKIERCYIFIILTFACIFASLHVPPHISFCGHMTCWQGHRYTLYMMIFHEFISLSSSNCLFEFIAYYYHSFMQLLYPFLISIDASKSSKRKAARGMSTSQYTYCVARTTFRGQICLYWNFFFIYTPFVQKCKSY